MIIPRRGGPTDIRRPRGRSGVSRVYLPRDYLNRERAKIGMMKSFPHLRAPRSSVLTVGAIALVVLCMVLAGSPAPLGAGGALASVASPHAVTPGTGSLARVGTADRSSVRVYVGGPGPYVPYGPVPRPHQPLDAYDGGGRASVASSSPAPAASGPLAAALSIFANASTTWGPAPLTVGFTPKVLTPQPAFDPLTYSVTYGDGASATGTWNGCDLVYGYPTGSCPAFEHTYTQQGSYVATMTLTNQSGAQGQASVTITVSAGSTTAGWSELSPASIAPSPRDGAAMAYDYPDEKVILFGGYDTGAYMGDTWEYQNSVWTNLTLTLGGGAPTPRYGALMAWDQVDNELVMVGGYNVTSAGSYANDTWVLSGNSWIPEAPLPRQLDGNNEMVTSPWNGEDGGVLATGMMTTKLGQTSAQTWLFQGGSWSLVTLSDPGAQWDPEAGDAPNPYVLSLGGNGSYNAYALTPSYLGTSWTGLALGTEPAFTGWAPMVNSNITTGLIVLPALTNWFSCCHQPSQVWTYFGEAWTNVSSLLTVAPSDRFGAAVSVDAEHGTVLVFGGLNESSGQYLGDTWMFGENAGPQATLTAHPADLTLGETTSLNATALPPGPGLQYSYTWLPPGCTSVSAPSLVCTPTVAGSYFPTVWVNSSGGYHAPPASTSLMVNSNLMVGASASPTYGDAPLAIQFNGTVTGGTAPYTWSWDFGDGSPSSSVENPSHTYALDGKYAAQLTVTDSVGNVGTATIVFRVGVWVTASASPTTGGAPLTVDFTSLAHGGSGVYTSYAWHFGDGTLGSSENMSHTYATSGTYTAWVNVSDSAGTYNISNVLTITVSHVLDVVATATPASGTVPLAVLFNGTVSGGVAPYSWTWNFSDRPTFPWDLSHLENPTHQFNATGTYPVTLTVTDAIGDSQIVTVPVTVTSSNASLAVSAVATPLTGPAPLAVDFKATATGGTAMYTSWAWVFGDGGTSVVENPSHTYATAGSYPVSVTVTDSRDATASADLTVTVTSGGGNPLEVDPTASPSSGTAPLNVSFQTNPSGGTGSYTEFWEFGDGSSQWNVLDPYHVYSTSGSYEATVYLYDTAGASVNASLSVTVSSGCSSCPLAATLHDSPSPMVVGEAGSFWANASGGSPPYTATWSFGDGSNASGLVAQHAYSSAGTYTATAYVFDSGHQEVVGTLSVDVVACASGCSSAPQVSISPSPSSGAAPLRVVFTSVVAGGTAPYSLFYCFDDGTPCLTVNTSATSVAVAHTYADPGVYTSTVTLTDASGRQTAADTVVTVTGSAPLSASAAESPSSGVAPLNVSFWANVTGGTPPYSIGWSFGDGSQGSGVPGEGTFHVFAAPGTYTPVLVVMDSAGHEVNYTLPSIAVSGSAAKGSGASSSPATSALAVTGLIAGALGAVWVGAMWQYRRRREAELKTQGSEMVAAMEGDLYPAAPPEPPLRTFK